jgi:hypothetical protein
MVSKDMTFKPGDRVVADKDQEGIVLGHEYDMVVVRMDGLGKYGAGDICWHPTRLVRTQSARIMPDPLFSLEEITEL